jgi:hypothetical protein
VGREDIERRIAELREKAARCRRLTASGDAIATANLRAYAIELDAEVASLEAKLEESISAAAVTPPIEESGPRTRDIAALRVPNAAADEPKPEDSTES